MDSLPELDGVAIDPDKDLPDPDPFQCGICGEDIKVGEKFFTAFTLEDPITLQGGYLRKEPRKAWSREESYIHLSHVGIDG